MDGVTRRIAEVYPLSNKGWGAKVERLQNDFTSRDTIKDLWLLMGAVGFVLLIACVNVANLLLARGTTRQKEVAVRTSLGATPWQVLSQFLTESLALALIGGTLGIGLASAMLKVILAILPPFSIPTEADIHVSVSVLVFTLAATALAGVLCGCAPAWQSSRWNLIEALKEGGRSLSQHSQHRLRECGGGAGCRRGFAGCVGRWRGRMPFRTQGDGQHRHRGPGVSPARDGGGDRDRPGRIDRVLTVAGSPAGQGAPGHAGARRGLSAEGVICRHAEAE